MFERKIAATSIDFLFSKGVASLGLKPSVFLSELDVDGKHYLFHSKTRSFVRLRSPLSTILASSGPAVRRLVELGYLVPLSASNRDEYEQLFRDIAQPNHHLNLLFTPNTTCNLACSYCFENRVRRTVMSDSTYRATVAWLEKVIISRNIKEVSINLFGGEPMLEYSLLTNFLHDLERLRRTHDFRIRSVQLTTNGLEHSEFKLGELRNLGVTEVQITVDGDKAANDSRRLRRAPARANQTSSVYDDVIQSLPIYSRYFPVILKINFDASTIATVEAAVVHAINTPELTKRNFMIKPEPIAIWRNSRAPEKRNLYDRGSVELAEAFGKIINLAIREDVSLDLSAVFPTPCMVSSENSYLLEPSGKLRSCISAFGLDAFSAGSVHSPSTLPTDRSNLRTHLNTPGLEKCIERSCSYMAVCDGGCKYETYLSQDTLNFMHCGYDYFKSVVPHYIRGLLHKASRVEELFVSSA
ncbi:radical SAM/SPASM domain-containing protein [Roseomonas mucosa]|uniref:radical SAM/SPASM domain-containing protein n=1 Tax=Roseomonas mucosa TaxID=207340 RepID=UPI0028CD833F|nr:radical SAM protein [Roseomonas mucosa]MDT8316206.1 4Fe-4S cluster-binding domain-containing protein [Roseomonas mucosa]MDT8362825.1 4Fe-4S cluster-binding domain-containing protein [Roseomonas mucosa]